MWNGINRRKFPRANYECRIVIKKRQNAKTISTQTENIGAGGICVIIGDDLGLFQGVDIELFLDDGKGPIKCGGTVVWVVRKTDLKQKGTPLFDTGVEFVDMRPEDRERTTDIVEKILKKQRR